MPTSEYKKSSFSNKKTEYRILNFYYREKLLVYTNIWYYSWKSQAKRKEIFSKIIKRILAIYEGGRVPYTRVMPVEKIENLRFVTLPSQFLRHFTLPFKVVQKKSGTRLNEKKISFFSKKKLLSHKKKFVSWVHYFSKRRGYNMQYWNIAEFVEVQKSMRFDRFYRKTQCIFKYPMRFHMSIRNSMHY